MNINTETNSKYSGVSMMETPRNEDQHIAKLTSKKGRSKSDLKIIEEKEVQMKKKMKEEIDDEIQKNIKEKDELNENDVGSMLKSIITRKRFKYSPKMIFFYLLRCLCIRNISKNRK